MATVSITSNEGALESASAVLGVTATNPEYNQPALHIKQASTRGGAASIRIDDPNPDIEVSKSCGALKFLSPLQADRALRNFPCGTHFRFL